VVLIRVVPKGVVLKRVVQTKLVQRVGPADRKSMYAACPYEPPQIKCPMN
jgi:hypothetical protein